MGSPTSPLQIGIAVDISQLQSGMKAGAETVKGGAAEMASSFKEAELAAKTAAKNMAEAQLTFGQAARTGNAQAVAALKEYEKELVVAQSQVEKMTAAKLRASDSWNREMAAANAAAEQEAESARAMELAALKADILARSLQEVAVAEEAAGAAAGAAVPEMAAASAMVRTLEGGGTIRAAERFLSTTLGLGPALQKLFPVIGAVAFAEILGTMAEKMSVLIADTFIYTDAMKAAYAQQLAVNGEVVKSLQRIHELQIEHFDYTHNGVENAKRSIEEETAKQKALTQELEKQNQLLNQARSAKVTATHYDDKGNPTQVSFPDEKEQAKIPGLASTVGALNAKLEESKAAVTVLNDKLNEQKDKALKEAAEAARRAAEELKRLAEAEKQLAASRAEMERIGIEETKNAMSATSLRMFAVDQDEVAQFEQNVQRKVRAIELWMAEQKKAEKIARELATAEAEGQHDKNLADIQLAQQAVKGSASLGIVSPEKELAELRMLHQQEAAENLRFIQQKIEIAKQDPDNPQKVQQLENQKLQIIHKANQQELADEIAKNKQKEQMWKRQGQLIQGSLNSALRGIATDTESVSEAFGKMFDDILLQEAEWGLEWLEKKAAIWAAEKLLGIEKTSEHSAENVAQATSDAAVAAAGTFAYFSATDPYIAPAMATIAYGEGMGWAGLAAFEQGGIVPKTDIALLHKNEMVLPAPIAQPLIGAIRSGGFGGKGGGDVHYHDHSNFSAFDHEKLGPMMEKHEGRVVGMVLRAIRDGRIKPTL